MSQSPSIPRFRNILKIKNHLNLWIAGALFFIWVVLYLPHLRTSPTWYGDETFTLSLAQSTFAGHPQTGALDNTFFRPGYQAGYAFIAGIFSWLTGGDISGARFFNALLALLCAWCLAFQTRKFLGVIGALFAALLFLGYEQTVIHFRMVYPHNLVALGFIISVSAMESRKGWWSDFIVGFGLLLASLAHPLALYAAVGLIPAILIWRRNFFIIYGIPLVPGLIYLLLLYLIYGRHLIQDISWMATTYSGGAKDSGSMIFSNLGNFFTQDILHILSVLGLIYAFFKKRWALAFCSLVIALLLLANRSNLIPFYYQAIVLLPFVCMCTALTLVGGLAVIRRFYKPAALPYVILCAGVILCYAPFKDSLKGTLVPRNAPWTTQSIQDVEGAADFINSHTVPEDYVVANGNLAWLLHCRTADMLQATAWFGFHTYPYEDGMPQDRYRFQADPSLAKYIVFGDIDNIWGVQQPHVKEVLDNTFKQGWEPVWTSRFYVVYGHVHPHLLPPQNR